MEVQLLDRIELNDQSNIIYTKELPRKYWYTMLPVQREASFNLPVQQEVIFELEIAKEMKFTVGV